MGRVISGRYEELEQLGQGSQGVVYKVRHIEHKTDLALKVLPSYLLEDEEMVARFEKEALVMTRLRHRNIARVLGSGRDEVLKLHFIVMEYIQGKNLKQHLREKGPLPLPEVLEITRQIAGALEYAHSQPSPIIHRDIKPTNIMIEDFSGRVVVLDFGIAKELGESERSPTRTGVMLGTWKYCAPEQLRHEPITGSVDVYSLGMVMYEMYTGTPFFSGLDEHAVLGKVLYEPREHEPYFARQTLPAFVSLVTKAIAKSRDKRYRRMADLLNDLEACWWALDDTKTIILPPQGIKPRQSEGTSGDSVELEEQVHHLEEERQRHAIVATQGQVRNAKEQAEREGARQWAPTLFEQGLAQEAKGEEQRRERQYREAQEAYEAALALFAQASEEAGKTAAVQQVEKERQEAATAKADAERYRAQDHTNATYARALAALTQANQLWEQKLFAQAGPLYRDARHLFEDARDFAYREIERGEVETAREQARAMRAAALVDGAETFAAALFAEGQESEQRAVTAFEQDDFIQARQFYFAAQQKYENAQRQAKRSQQRRQEVLALAAQVQAMQQQAVAAGARVQRQSSYTQADDLVRQATSLLDAQEYTRAGQAYTQARDLYEAALRAVEEELKQDGAQNARAEAAAARNRAEKAGAARWFPAAWDDGQKKETAGNEAATRERWEEALQHYQHAQQQWEDLYVAVLKRQEQTQAEHSQQATQEARTAADRAGVQEKLPDDYAQAMARQTQADQLFAQQDYSRAQALYAEAQTFFTQALERVQQAALKDAVDLAQTSMQAAQKAALLVNAEALATGLIQEALVSEQQAETALAHGEFARARQLYEAAQQQYVKAEEQARAEQQRQMQQAVVAAREVQVVQERVGAMGANLDSFPAYREATAAHQQAATLFAAQQYVQAEGAYQQARTQYEAVIVAAEQQQIALAQERALAAQDAAMHTGVAQFFAEEWEEISRDLTTAQQHADQGETTQAVAAFQRTERRFAQLRQTAAQRKAQEEERQRELVLAARRTTEERQATAENAEALRYAATLYGQAKQLMDEGELHVQEGRWQEALACLTQAQDLFGKATESAHQEKAQHAADAARTKAVAAQQEVQKGRGPEYFPERFAQATTLVRKAEGAFQRGDFSLAQRGFEEGALLLQKIRQTASIREEAEEQLAAMKVSEFPVPGEEESPDSTVVVARQEIPLTSRATLPPQAQSGQRREVSPAIQRSQRGSTLEESPQEVTLIIPPPRQVREPSPLTPALRTIPPTRLPSRMYILIGAVLFLLAVGGYFLRPHSVDEPAKGPQIPPPPKTPDKLPSEKKIRTGATSSVPTPARQDPNKQEPQVAKASPAPSAPPPLTLRRVEPEAGRKVVIKEGETLAFAVAIDETERRTLQYRWTLNGTEQSTAPNWTYKPTLDEAEDAPKTIQVVVRDTTGQTVEQNWRVQVDNVNRPPTITDSTPRLGAAIQVAAGVTQNFSVSATDPDKEDSLTYRWILDGNEVSQGQRENWQFRAPTSDGSHQLVVEIQDPAGGKIQHQWDILVRAVTPFLRWARLQPREERLRAQVGQPVDFTAVAEMVRTTRGIEGIQYQWRVNDTLLQTEETGRFRFSEEQAGMYQVSVIALNTEGSKSPLRKWAVDVRALEPTPVAPREDSRSEGPAVGRCANDVRRWLESFKRAWETKNVRTLASLGIISRWDMDRVAENLRQSQVFRVTLTDVDIQCEGEQATVSFKRVDTIDGTTFVHPERAVFHLEKRDGRMAIRRQ
jgi:predicted Ser/Thr protein kinase